jgi:hypothetical protein
MKILERLAKEVAQNDRRNTDYLTTEHRLRLSEAKKKEWAERKA